MGHDLRRKKDRPLTSSFWYALLAMRSLTLFLIGFISSTLPLNAHQTTGSIDVPSGVELILQAKGEGVQIYNCTDTSDGAKWVLQAPHAKLLDASGKEIGTHFAGPTWKLNDGSQVEGEPIAHQDSSDPNSIPWLLLRAKSGTATGKLATITFIRRTETHGGEAPQTDCTPSGIDRTIQVPYTAIYSFYGR